jgi:hypothetical protein
LPAFSSLQSSSWLRQRTSGPEDHSLPLILLKRIRALIFTCSGPV